MIYAWKSWIFCWKKAEFAWFAGILYWEDIHISTNKRPQVPISDIFHWKMTSYSGQIRRMNSSFSIQNSSFLLHNSSFSIQNSWCLIHNSIERWVDFLWTNQEYLITRWFLYMWSVRSLKGGSGSAKCVSARRWWLLCIHMPEIDIDLYIDVFEACKYSVIHAGDWYRSFSRSLIVGTGAMAGRGNDWAEKCAVLNLQWCFYTENDAVWGSFYCFVLFCAVLCCFVLFFTFLNAALVLRLYSTWWIHSENHGFILTKWWFYNI